MCVTYVYNRNEMTVLAGKNEELQQKLDAAKKSLKERARTRRQLEKVLQDAAFAVQSMLTVNINYLLSNWIFSLSLCS